MTAFIIGFICGFVACLIAYGFAELPLPDDLTDEEDDQ